MSGPAHRRTVAIWRDEWLPSSETFILDQISSMSRWTPVPIAAYESKSNALSPKLPIPKFVPTRIAPRFVRSRLGRKLVARELTSNGVAIVHAHFGTGGITVLPAARQAQIPLVVTFHGFDATRLLNGSGAASQRYQRALKGVFEYAGALVAVSDFIASNLSAAGAPEGLIRVLPIGSRPHLATESEVLPRDGLLFVGRLVEKKGVEDLLLAVSLLDEPQRSVQVTIIGDGPERAALEAIAARLYLNVRFVGAQSHDAVRVAMDRAALFVAPSKTASDGDAEGFGMVFLEAAQARLATVAYNHGGVTEAVLDGKTGLLAPEGDVKALSDNISALLANPERAEILGRAGRARAVAEYDVSQRTAILEELYEEVVGSSAARA